MPSDGNDRNDGVNSGRRLYGIRYVHKISNPPGQPDDVNGRVEFDPSSLYNDRGSSGSEREIRLARWYGTLRCADGAAVLRAIGYGGRSKGGRIAPDGSIVVFPAADRNHSVILTPIRRGSDDS